jgi:phage terminase large subunit-like protein
LAKTKTVIKPQKGSQELAMNIKADFIIYGGAAGSGKTHLLLMKVLPYIKDPNFQASFFRRNTKQLKQQGGIWEESKKMYAPFKPLTNNTDLKHVFPEGSTLTFNHLEHEKHKYSFQGGQLSAALFDELTHFSQTQVTYILSRLRSDAEVDGFAFGTCNPDNQSWVLNWVEWWLDEDGFPDKEKQGILRYYLLIDDSPVFADTPEELEELYPEQCKVWNPNDNEWIKIRPKSFTFIAGNIFHNQELIKRNPKYLAELNSLPRVERARLLEGNWYAVPESEGYCKREWLLKADTIPLKAKKVRAWDKASTEPSEVNRYPDFTASIGLAKDIDNTYYLFGNYCPENKDKIDPEIRGRFRRRAGERDSIVLKQSQWDGEDTIVVMPKDAGAAGEVEFRESAKKLIEGGFVVKQDPYTSNKSKLTRFTPFAAACENGLVHIVESSFDRKTLEYLYKELESFNGERSTSARKDDLADSCASAFNYLSKQKVLPAFSLNVGNSRNNLSNIKQSVFATK